jgi:Ca2+-binding EF-hand superfamily protein
LAVIRSFILAVGAASLALGAGAYAQAGNGAKPVPRADFVKSVDARFAAVDTNHDGTLSKSELQAAQARVMQQMMAARQQRIQAEFKQLDTNHDGQLSAQEFAAAVPTLRASETSDQMMQQLDTNHDGKVGPDEFRAPQLAKFAKLDANHDGVVTPAEMSNAAASNK